MGVYIPKFNIPEQGNIVIAISANGKVYAVRESIISETEYVADAVTVKEPHGRLIDESKVYSTGVDADAGHCITDAPTIIEAEGEE